MTRTNPHHLLHVFSTFGVGGPQVRSCDVFNHFGRRYTHTILAMDGNYDAKTRLSSDLSVNFPNMNIQKKATFHNVVQFRNALHSIQPDLLVTYNWGAIEWSMANDLWPICPHIHLEEGFNPDEMNTQKKRRIFLRWLFLSRAWKVVVPSLTLHTMALTSWKLPSHKVEYIPNGIDCQRFKRDEAAASPGDVLIIGTVAGLRKVKNIPRLIRAFARLPKDDASQLWIIGTGSEYDALANIIRDGGLSDRIKLFGHIADPSGMLKQMHIFAISSDTEQMPTSVLEAMASGLPIVGTDVGDLKQMVAPSNQAFIVEKTDEDGFFQALQTLRSHPAQRTAIGQENRQKCVACYSQEVVFENYHRLFESAMMSGRKKYNG